MRNVAVLGSDVADRLFPFEDPLEQTVRLGNYFYEVVGVVANRMPMAAVGGSSQSAEDFNNDVYIPLRTCRVRFGDKIIIRQSGSFSGEQVELSQVTLTVRDMDSVRPTGDSRERPARDALTSKNDWAVTVPLDRLEAAEREKDRLTHAAGHCRRHFAAGRRHRHHEHHAGHGHGANPRDRHPPRPGAKRKDIILQFLIEAVVQTTLGGLIGALVGIVVVFTLPWLAQHVFNARQPAVLNVPWIFYSLTLDLVVGVIFGLYPAWRASRLDPIEALRHCRSSPVAPQPEHAPVAEQPGYLAELPKFARSYAR